MRQDGVGNIAINDAFMLEAAIYHLLKKHFRSEAYYVDLLELFLEVSRQAPRSCEGCDRYEVGLTQGRQPSRPSWAS